MSVSMTTRKTLGSDITPVRVVAEISDAIYQMETDAALMGVTPVWSTIVIKLGNEYDEVAWGWPQTTLRAPVLEIELPAYRTKHE